MTALPCRPRVGVSVLVTSGDRVLLGRRLKEPNRGLWVLPGGGVRPYESIADAARRELLEEAGAQIVVGQFLDMTEVIRSGEEHRIILTFWAGLATPEGELREGDDLGSPTLFTRDELTSLAISDVVRPVLERAGWLDPRVPR